MSELEAVDTEAQRAELEAMSQALLDRLNTMVAEQEQRAAEFADRTHSLSALPAEINLPQVESTLHAPEPLPAVRPLPQERKLPPPPAARRVDPPPTARREEKPAARQPQRHPAAPAKKKEEGSSIGVGGLGVVLVVIYALLRACSN